MLKITHTILDGNCGDLTKDEIEAYSTAVNAAIKAKYNDADVETEIIWNTSGIGGGIEVQETDGIYEISPDDVEWDTESVAEHCRHIAEKIFETAGA